MQEKEYEVKPHYEEHNKRIYHIRQCNISIVQCMKGLPRINGTTTQPTITRQCGIQAQRLSWPPHHNSVGPFRHDDSADRSQRAMGIQLSKEIRLNIALRSSHTKLKSVKNHLPKAVNVRVDAQLANLWRPPPLLSSKAAAAAAFLAEICSGQLDEENPSAPISSGLLVQADEGVSLPIVDLIDVIYRRLP
ncbi:hypothetical protein F511_10377 [Dorcoceras hygrometricum]|uniref:Uncharacterized protein n=1 Tax=Dorcoceras hygrometricum TaxID=472368 RepID=A0A2Z7CBK1_9LAMI|nr:hypothetical protein F511_10377 [Dorcoceras hygrometricum]